LSEVRASIPSEALKWEVDLLARKEDVRALRDSVLAKLKYSVGKDPLLAGDRDWFVATALAVRDRIVDRWLDSTTTVHTQRRKHVYYLSLEFLIGQLLTDALNNLGLTELMRE
jgi:starch phosphorylase